MSNYCCIANIRGLQLTDFVVIFFVSKTVKVYFQNSLLLKELGHKDIAF